MNRVNEIHIEGVGTVRHLTDSDVQRLRRVRGPNRHIAPYALSSGISIRKFKSLPVELQQEVRAAYNALCSSTNMISIKEQLAAKGQ